jgi:hypothetical protein
MAQKNDESVGEGKCEYEIMEKVRYKHLSWPLKVAVVAGWVYLIYFVIIMFGLFLAGFMHGAMEAGL